ncbi:MAG: AEC family transporter [Cyanobacteria bacterium P01_H01_bin.121]
MSFFSLIVKLYLPIGTAVVAGLLFSFLLRRKLIQQRLPYELDQKIPAYLGKFLFLIGVPLSVINFIRKADLSGTIWIAPVVAWGAILFGMLCAWLWLRSTELEDLKSRKAIAIQDISTAHLLGQASGPSAPVRGSFTLATMVGNTGYMGFPIILLLPQLGPDYFGWALLYDALGTFFGAYGIGVILAARFRSQHQTAQAAAAYYLDTALPTQTQAKENPVWGIVKELVKNPTIFAFVIGLLLRSVVFPELADYLLNGFAWTVVMLSLGLMGMRLQQLDSWSNLRWASVAVAIKMLLIPLTVAMFLTAIGIEGPPRLVLILQSAMPSAFATLVLAEAYNLDRDLVVTALGLSSATLVFTLPFWLWGFATW